MWNIADRRQVFVDGRFLEDASNVELRVMQPDRLGPVLEPEHPWERTIGPFVSVAQDSRGYHLWYMCCPDFYTSESMKYVAYARSADGLIWEKPKLGLGEICGTTQNNVVYGPGIEGTFRPSGFAVSIDPTAPDSERFRMTQHPRELGKNHLHVYSSPDGCRWTLTHRDVIAYDEKARLQLDSNNAIFWDARIGRYVAYVRRNFHRFGQDRGVVRAEAADLMSFPPLMEFEKVLAWDERDPSHEGVQLCDWYTSNVVRYPWAADCYLMFPSIYLHFEKGCQRPFEDDAPWNAGLVDLRFGASRDGVKWERYDRRPYAAHGLQGTWDSRRIYGAYGLVDSPDESACFVYYAGREDPHAWEHSDENRDKLRAAGFAPANDHSPKSGIGLLKVRRDGFVAVQSTYEGGHFRTPAVRFEGNRLLLNLNTSAAGEVRVAMETADGQAISGFGLADCDAIFGVNALNCEVRWRGQFDVSSLSGQPIRLRFVMRDTSLFAFQFTQ